MKTLLSLLWATFVLHYAQASDLKQYWVHFLDKNNSPYSVERPEEFLSPRAVMRRQKQDIPITISDLPLNPQYLSELKELGVQILHTSKWFNAATIVCNSQTITKVSALPFIDSIQYVGKLFRNRLVLEEKTSSKKRVKKPFDNHYGFASSQIEMLNGHRLHKLGYLGDGVLIAILDAGFYNADKSLFFEELRKSGKLLYPKDYVNLEELPFQSSTHGTHVLSVMAANIPGLMVGTAPNATYLCIKTEDSRGEFRFEECNWIAGLEYADSMGVDIINSSLGYTFFEDATMNYAIEDLDGKTALCSQAAEMAFQKGMIVVNSAGNEGKADWKYVACPADAAHILAIGAIDLDEQKTDFSSFGPSSDGRIKPELVALGESVAVASAVKPHVLSGMGTSYSAPIVCGLVAVLWQAFPDKTNQEIIQAVKSTAFLASSPNNRVGYGKPDFWKAFLYLKNN